MRFDFSLLVLIGMNRPDIDEDISAEGMLSGVPAKQPREIEKKSAWNEHTETKGQIEPPEGL